LVLNGESDFYELAFNKNGDLDYEDLIFDGEFSDAGDTSVTEENTDQDDNAVWIWDFIGEIINFVDSL
jgi:hypothetical protein